MTTSGAGQEHEPPVLLTAEWEVTLIKRAHAGDRGALHELVMAHQSHVRKAAWCAIQHAGVARNIDVEDLIQYCILRLLDGYAIKFDPSRARFSTFIRPWLRHWLSLAIGNERRHAGGANDHDTSVRSLDEPLAGDGGDDMDLCLQDVLPDQGIPLDELVEQSLLADDIEAVLGMPPPKGRKRGLLTTREADALRCRFGLDGTRKGRTLSEVGDLLGVTDKRVLQLEQRGLQKLRWSPVARARLADYASAS